MYISFICIASQWQSVAPKYRGRFSLRLLVNEEGRCHHKETWLKPAQHVWSLEGASSSCQRVSAIRILSVYWKFDPESSVHSLWEFSRLAFKFVHSLARAKCLCGMHIAMHFNRTSFNPDTNPMKYQRIYVRLVVIVLVRGDCVAWISVRTIASSLSASASWVQKCSFILGRRRAFNAWSTCDGVCVSVHYINTFYTLLRPRTCVWESVAKMFTHDHTFPTNAFVTWRHNWKIIYKNHYESKSEHASWTESQLASNFWNRNRSRETDWKHVDLSLTNKSQHMLTKFARRLTTFSVKCKQ